jgi:hypothetical protein
MVISACGWLVELARESIPRASVPHLPEIHRAKRVRNTTIYMGFNIQVFYYILSHVRGFLAAALRS